jgi:hypothetical protein
MGVTVGGLTGAFPFTFTRLAAGTRDDLRIQFRIVFQEAVEHEDGFPRPARDRLPVKRQAVPIPQPLINLSSRMRVNSGSAPFRAISNCSGQGVGRYLLSEEMSCTKAMLMLSISETDR